MRKEKAQKIKETLTATRQRRKNQIPRVYQLKLQNLSKKDKEELNRLFLEAKWLYNYIVADVENRLNNDSWKLKEVEIKTPERLEKREIRKLSSQMRQGIVERIKRSLYSLKRAKEKGIKVGKLSFKSEIRSIPLKQYDITYKISGDRNRIKIQGIKKKFRVLGLHQIPKNSELAEAQLVKKSSGYYLHVVCYLPKEEVMKEIKKKQKKVAIEKLKGEGKLLKTLPVDSGEVTPVEWELSHDEAGSPSL